MSATLPKNSAPSRRGIGGDVIAAREYEPYVYWATLGVLIMAFWTWIMVKWVTGPYFVPTPPGPTAQPEWQTYAQIAFQAFTIFAFLILIYKLIVKPWRQERRFTTDGALLIAYFTMYFQDQISFMGGGYWFTYNAHVWNMGSWFPEIPGWMAFAQPGQTAGEPILMMGPGYAYFFVIMTALGIFIMRKFRDMWPWMPTPLLFLSVLVATALMDMVIEVGFWIPLGFYSYTYGGFLPMINAGTMHQFPMAEALGIGVLSTTIVAFRYYTNDKGQTIAERGLEKVTSPVKQGVLRMFAMIAMIQLIFFFPYNVSMYMLGQWSSDWPKEIQERSYLTNGICGAGTPRACRTSETPVDVPSATGISVTPDGQLMIPAGAKKPQGAIPFITGP